MIKSCAGVEPLAGMATVMFPLNPTGLAAFMSNSVSVERTDHADSSMTKVNEPPERFWFAMVRLTGDGGGEKSAISNVSPYRESRTLESWRRII